MSRRNAAPLWAALSFACLAAVPRCAQADVKIISDVKVTTRPGSSDSTSTDAAAGADVSTPAPAAVSDTTYVTYFQGRKARRETADGSRVLIYDRDTDKVYALNPKDKTYYVLPFDIAVDFSGQLPEQASARMTLERHLDFNEAKGAGVQTSRTIADLVATHYAVDGSVALKPKSSGGAGGGMGRHGRHGGGGFPGGGGGYPGSGGSGGGGYPGGGSARASATKLQIAGDVWCADADLLLAPDADSKKFDADSLLSLVQQVMAGRSAPLVKPLIDAAGKKHLVPVSSDIILTSVANVTSSYVVSEDPTDASAPTPPPAQPSTEYSMEVESVDARAVVDPALFTVPTGYTLVDAPPPSMPAPVSPPRSSSDDDTSGQN